jgi:hypothetical protein
MVKWIDELESSDREKRQAQAQKEEYLRQHSQVRWLVRFWPSLVSAVQGQCTELDRHFAGNPNRRCRFVTLSEKSFQVVTSTGYERLVKAELFDFDIFLLFQPGSYHCSLSAPDLARLVPAGQLTPEDVAADFLRWVLRESDPRSRSWYRPLGTGTANL